MSDLLMGLIIGIAVGGTVGLIFGGVLASSDAADEYADTVEELGRALREAYAWIHVAGDWDEFSKDGFVVNAPTPSPLTSYMSERAARDARSRSRFMGANDVEDVQRLGHVRLGIDPGQRTDRRSR